MSFLKTSLIGALLFSATTWGSTIAIIDSGVDVAHKDIEPNAWINPGEIERNRVDDDQNGYVDDVYGWNFAEQNNKVIDYKYLGTLTTDIEQFFEIQAKEMQDIATLEDKRWMYDLRENMKKGDEEAQDLFKRLSVYGNFMHGTHVAGIAIKQAPQSKVIAMKLLPTEQNNPIADLMPKGKAQKIEKTCRTEFDVELDPKRKERLDELREFLSEEELKEKIAAYEKELALPMCETPVDGRFDWVIKGLVKFGATFLTGQQIKLFETLATYANDNNADVANGSFGTPYFAMEQAMKGLGELILRRPMRKEEVTELAQHLVKSLIREGDHMVQRAPNTLFVFAAGNDGGNNDERPTFPTNVKAANSISVAAMLDGGRLAKFSNHGVKTVEVAAPGVNIESAVPGNRMLRVSGTSQAAPYVAGMAANMKDLNPDLTPSQLKRIIMETTDFRQSLKGKVATSGVVNADRANLAAQLTRGGMTLTDAIAKAKVDVEDPGFPFSDERGHTPNATIILPLPSLFR